LEKILIRNGWSKTFDLKTRETATFIKTFPGVGRLLLETSGVLLMANGSKLFARKKSDFAWVELADFPTPD